MSTEYFLEIFKKAQKKYGKSTYRLAGEGWKHPWQTLIVTIMSAQSRDETTIPIAEGLFKDFPTLKSLADADYAQVLKKLSSLNYNRTKAKHIISCAATILYDLNGNIPKTIDELIKLPGVGRKTANLYVGEVLEKPSICVDTHVHRICNVLGIVNTKTPTDTEMALREIVPKRLWSKINRLFVLWGKEVPGQDKDRLLAAIDF